MEIPTFAQNALSLRFACQFRAACEECDEKAVKKLLGVIDYIEPDTSIMDVVFDYDDISVAIAAYSHLRQPTDELKQFFVWLSCIVDCPVVFEWFVPVRRVAPPNYPEQPE